MILNAKLDNDINGLDCAQSLFSSKIRGKERKTSTLKRANVTVSVTCERRYREPLVGEKERLLTVYKWACLFKAFGFCSTISIQEALPQYRAILLTSDQNGRLKNLLHSSCCHHFSYDSLKVVFH